MNQTQTVETQPSAPIPPLAAQPKVAEMIAEAIAGQRRIAWVYNKTRMLAGPQILYIRDDALFVDAVVFEKDGSAPQELKLGSFKLRGLRDLELSDISFARSRLFNPREKRYGRSVLVSIES